MKSIPYGIKTMRQVVMVGFLIKDMREIDNFDEMCESSFAIQGSKQFAAQNLRFLGFPSVGKVFPSAG